MEKVELDQRAEWQNSKISIYLVPIRDIIIQCVVLHCCPIALGFKKTSHTPGTWVTSNEIAKFSQNVTSNLHHVFMAGRGLQGLQNKVTTVTKRLHRFISNNWFVMDLQLPNSVDLIETTSSSVQGFFFKFHVIWTAYPKETCSIWMTLWMETQLTKIGHIQVKTISWIWGTNLNGCVQFCSIQIYTWNYRDLKIRS